MSNKLFYISLSPFFTNPNSKCSNKLSLSQGFYNLIGTALCTKCLGFREKWFKLRD